MPKDYRNRSGPIAIDFTKEPLPVAPTRWVGGHTLPYGFKPPTSPTSKKPGAANRIPPEIAARISGYLEVKDLARTALAWRSVAFASYASPEFIKLECAKYSLLTNPSAPSWPPATVQAVRERIRQYNFAWSTLQFSGSQSFNIPETTQDTAWAGSKDWKTGGSGSRFMGESNGYIYDVYTFETPGPVGHAKLGVYQLPSLRTGETDLKKLQINVELQSKFVKAVTVDPVAKLVAVLEVTCGMPRLHVYNFRGQYWGGVQIRSWFESSADVYHMELHGEMVCIVAHYSSSKSLIGTASSVVIQNWAGEQRSVRMSRFLGTDHMNYCTGLQFITEDLYIATEKGRTDPRDTIPTHLIRVGHVRLKKQILVDLKDALGDNWTPNNISLIRNLSHYSPADGPFCANPASRLFGIKFEYRNFDGTTKSNCCLFGRATVESWLGIGGPPDHMHWLTMPLPNEGGARADPTNREGLYVVGRRLFWATIWQYGWSLNVIDYNPGAGNAIPETLETRGGEWKSWTGLFCNDPFAVAISSTTRICHLTRVVPTEDGILLKNNDPNAPDYTMLMM